jgi:hypothetical protein
LVSVPSLLTTLATLDAIETAFTTLFTEKAAAEGGDAIYVLTPKLAVEILLERQNQSGSQISVKSRNIPSTKASSIL